MEQNNMKKREIEARGYLQRLLNMANDKGWSNDKTSFCSNSIDEGLDSLEIALEIYNIFAEDALELIYCEDDGLYKVM